MYAPFCQEHLEKASEYANPIFESPVAVELFRQMFLLFLIAVIMLVFLFLALKVYFLEPRVFVADDCKLGT